MTAWFYVRSGAITGTAASGSTAARVTTEKTGAWSSDTADSFALIGDAYAADTPPAAGDWIILASDNDQTLSQIAVSSIGSDALGIHCVSRDITDVQVGLIGAILNGSAGDCLVGNTTNSNTLVDGITFIAGDDNVIGTTGARVLARRCTFETSGGSDKTISTSGDGCYIRLEDCILDSQHATGRPILVRDGGYLEIYGGSVIGNDTCVNFIYGAGGTGGATIRVYGMDLSTLASSATLLADTGTSTATNNMDVLFYNCKLPATFAGAIDGTLINYGSRFRVELIGVDATDASVYELYTKQGFVVSQKTNYVTGHTQLQGSSNYAFQVTTHAAGANIVSPFRFAVPFSYDDWSSNTTMTLKFATSGSETLTKDDINMFLGVSNDTDPMLMDFKSSHGTGATWAENSNGNAGGALTTTSSQWSGFTPNAQYSMSITPADPQPNSPIAPIMWIEIYKAGISADLFIDSEITFS